MNAFWSEFVRVQQLVECDFFREEQLDSLLNSLPKTNFGFDRHDTRRRLKNLGRNLDRKERHRRKLLEQAAAQIAHSTFNSPLDQILSREETDTIRRVAGEDWELLKNTIDGDYKTMACQMGVSIGTLKSRVSRARAKLRIALRDSDLTMQR